MLDHLGLMAAIRWFAKSRLEPLGVRVRFKETNQSCRLYPEVEIALFRVIQEAVTNINRHAGARNVEICCELNADQALIKISDDGIGFDTSQITLSPESGQGLGLLGMRERLELVGGDFVLNSTPGIGTQIDIRVPLRHNK
jgi:signal transduction histidine kinase